MSNVTANFKWVTGQLLPEIFPRISWGSIWSKPPSCGDAYQFMVLFAIVRAALDSGWNVDLPILDFYADGSHFVLRNEIPHTHGAQAGNSASDYRSVPLKKRFLLSLIPKFTISKDNKFFSFFVEGCPYHKIMSGDNYLVRPDIAVFPGYLMKEKTVFSATEDILSFAYKYKEQLISGKLRVVSSPYIPCISRSPRYFPIAACAVIECSINKSVDVIVPQILKYNDLFSTEEEKVKISAVTGNDLTGLIPCQNYCLPFEMLTKEELLTKTLTVGEKTFESFNLTAL